jgi:RNA polymerase sigma-70 factor, ECF subfamily
MGMAQEYLKFLLGGGDPEDILQELIAEYEKDVWNYAFTLTKIYDRADDITQDVFVKVFRNLYSFRGESSVKTWLLSITRHTAYNYLKSAFFRKVTLVGFVLDRRNHASAEEEALDRIVTEDIWKMVLDLPVKLREVLVLTIHHSLSVTETALILNLPEGTVKSRLHYARKRLALLLEANERRSESYETNK